jgi:hypothetical protein
MYWETPGDDVGRATAAYPTPASLFRPPLAARSPARNPGAMHLVPVRLRLTLTHIHLSSRLGATLAAHTRPDRADL